ncbi:MAG: endolytic transglycosylase MltG [Lachnospiraceae bacterium]|nr:endolytic transglycosylase MltG [Lachnospiraceae bacterium]
MKLKYYLRGLGIGILVTVLILSIVPKEREALSDAEIRERALQLGMVDGSALTLTDVQNTQLVVEEQMPEESMEAEAPMEETEESIETSESVTEESVETTKSIENSESVTEETLESVESSQTVAEDVVVTITIKSGASSYTVSKDLAAAGLIEDAKAFDTYLCDNGYSRSISVGTYEIALGTTEEEIAKIISRKR